MFERGNVYLFRRLEPRLNSLSPQAVISIANLIDLDEDFVKEKEGEALKVPEWCADLWWGVILLLKEEERGG